MLERPRTHNICYAGENMDFSKRCAAIFSQGLVSPSHQGQYLAFSSLLSFIILAYSSFPPLLFSSSVFPIFCAVNYFSSLKSSTLGSSAYHGVSCIMS